jgi:hypothetical protein
MIVHQIEVCAIGASNTWSLLRALLTMSALIAGTEERWGY